MPDHTSKPVILYAEDDLDDFEALKDALDQVSPGYTLMRAKNGTEVLSYLREEKGPRPCLIVLDLNMPVMNGKETLLWLKEEEGFSSIPTMVFTTSSREEDMKMCQRYQCTFFRKPTLYRDLLHIAQLMQGMCAS